MVSIFALLATLDDFLKTVVKNPNQDSTYLILILLVTSFAILDFLASLDINMSPNC
jgi:hypothetical protein